MSDLDSLAFSRTIISLFKNAVYKEKDPSIWDVIIEHRYLIEDYVGKIGLILFLEEIDGYAFLRQRDYIAGNDEMPRLIPRHQLGYQVSLLLVLLRKQLLSFDSTTGDRRLVMTRQEIRDMIFIFLKDTTNEAKILKTVDKYIEQVEKMGFLRQLKGNEDAFEVDRILRNFVNADWLDNFNNKLDEYHRFANGGELAEGGGLNDFV